MRRLALGALVAFALCLASAVPALANSGNNGYQGFQRGPQITISCQCHQSTQFSLLGDLKVPNKSSGDVTLTLWGRNGPGAWNNTGMTVLIHVVMGKTLYPFSFNVNLDPHHYAWYEVSGDGATSRALGRDECGFRVPEAPMSSLLLLGGIPAGGLLALRVTGVRLPRPHFRRVA